MKAFILVILSLFLGASGNQQLANQLNTANVSQTLLLALTQGTIVENVDTHGGSWGW